MGEVRLDPERKNPSDIVVGDGFSVSTHFVKYSHHPSGVAQFSLTGKVKSVVRRTSASLSHVNGHFFTFMVQGLEHFDQLRDEERAFNPRKGVVEFGLDCGLDQSLKFVGYYYSERELASRTSYGANTPWIKTVTPDGRAVMGIALATNYMYRGERTYLMLTGEKIPTITVSQEAFLSFMGGFDPPEIAFNHRYPTSFLMFIYPVDAKSSTLENIDLIKETN